MSIESDTTVRKRTGFFFSPTFGQNHHLFLLHPFPGKLELLDLQKLFGMFGRVGEVFISKKMDRWGNRFGFVKFQDVVGEEDLGGRLEDVWWGDWRLKVNRARFGREDKVEVGEQKGG